MKKLEKFQKKIDTLKNNIEKSGYSLVAKIIGEYGGIEEIELMPYGDKLIVKEKLITKKE